MNRPLNILIAYADESMKYALKQIGIQAKYISAFDKTILYSRKDLPQDILDSPLMQHKRGGGYWAWKPYLIYKTLQDYHDGTRVCYIDAGCTIYESNEWDKYFGILDDTNTLLFQYAPHIGNWQTQFGQGDTAIKYWTKKSTLDFFDKYFNDEAYREFHKIWGGLIFCKGRNNSFVKEWLDITLQHPELVCDPMPTEEQYPFFSGHHRHDQSIITPLAFQRIGKGLEILPERFDENRCSAAVAATRNRVSRKRYYEIYLRFHLQGILGQERYDKLKRHLGIARGK